MSEHSSAPDTGRNKVDNDDHDLLTFGEVGERLRIEIASLSRQVSEFEASGDSEAIRRAQTRLSALRAAAARNAAHPINDANFERFFGYAGRARRNVPDQASSD